MKKQSKKDFSYVEVALPVSQFMTFTYRVKNLPDLVGRRVLVPFKTTKMTGIITDFSTNQNIKNIRNVEEIPDEEPVFPEDYIKLIKRISDYYITPIGITAYYCMPEGLRWKYDKKSGKWIKPYKEEKIYRAVFLKETKNLSPKAKELLEFISERGEITLSQIKEEGFSVSTVNSLIKKGFIKEMPHIEPEEEISSPILQPNKKGIKNGIFVYWDLCDKRLKHYIEIASYNISKNKGTLIIFPNISTIRAVYSRFKKIFGERLFLYHDAMPEEEKIKNWFNLKKTEGSITLGTLFSIFMPIKNLKTIIIEEEFSTSYKNLRNPRFDVRRAAFELYRIKRDISLIYAASVPSVETYYLITKGIAQPLNRKNPIRDIKASVEIKNSSITDPHIKNLIKQKNKKILIITNRKGYFSYLYCPRCEDEVKCTRCDIPLKAYTEEKNLYLQCELCGKKFQYTQKCSVCETPLRETGYGLEKIKEIIKRELRTEIFSTEEKKGSIHITTTLTGKDFLIEKYHYVININPDFYLFLHDFRGMENLFRAVLYPYYKAEERYIILSSLEKDTFPIKTIIRKDLPSFYLSQLKERKQLNLPPFSKIILLTFEKKNLTPHLIETIFDRWIKESSIKQIDYDGPYYAFYSYVRGKKRIQITLKNFKEKEKLKNLFKLTEKKGIKLIIEIEPKKLA